MAFGRRKNETPSSAQPAKKELPKTMPTRFQTGDQRAAGHETTYQPSRGWWLKKG